MEKRLKNIQTFEQMNLNEKKLSSWELSDRISNIIDSNIKEIPYEGTDVDNAKKARRFLRAVSYKKTRY